MSADLYYFIVGNHSVATNVEEFRALLGHNFEPRPSKTAVIVGGEEGIPGQHFVYPDQIPEISEKLGVEIPPSSLPLVGMSPPSEDSPVPEAVTATQARLWLFRNYGLSSDDVRNVIAAMPDPGESLIRWEYSPYIERSHPLVEAIGQTLGLSATQLDDAFREAVTYG